MSPHGIVMPRPLLAPLLLALAACTGRASTPEPAKPPMPSEPAVTDTYDPGPELTPSDDLVAWFKGDGAGKLVQLPVVVTPSVLGVSKGQVAGLEIKLEDTAMSVGLADRLRPDCPYDEPCAVWLEGVWGPTVDMPGPPMPSFGPDKETFSVRRYVGRVADGDEQRVRIPKG